MTSFKAAVLLLVRSRWFLAVGGKRTNSHMSDISPVREALVLQCPPGPHGNGFYSYIGQVLK